MAAHVNDSILEPTDPLSRPVQHKPLISDGKLKQLYTAMLRARQGRSSGSGNRKQKDWRFQEAPIVGCTIDLRAEDSLITSADLPGNTAAQRSVLDTHFVVALATGAALLHRLQSKGNLVVAFVEAKQLASNRELLRVAHMQSLPIIYVQVEKALPKAPRAHTLAASILVDTADMVAIYRVASEAIDKARRGAGPTLIQCVPFSLKKRPLANHHSQDPIRYMEYYLRKKSVWSDALNN